MAASPLYITTPVVTAGVSANDDSAKTTVGTIVEAGDGSMLMYVTATKTINQYDAVAIINSSSAIGVSIGVVPLSTGLVAVTNRVGFAQTAMAINTYGWVFLSGNNLRVNAAIACEPAVPLFTTATAGFVDDAIVSTGYIRGLTAMTSAASASAVQCVAGFCILETQVS